MEPEEEENEVKGRSEDGDGGGGVITDSRVNRGRKMRKGAERWRRCDTTGGICRSLIAGGGGSWGE